MSISSAKSARTPVAGWIARLRPSSPECPPRRWRRRNSGVWIAPHATTTASQSTITRPPPLVVASTPRARPPPIPILRARVQPHVVAPPPPAPPGPPRARAAERRRAGLPAARHVGQAGVLLGARRAAEGADPG